MDEDRLTAARDRRIAAGHVHRDILVRTEDHLKVGAPLLSPSGQRFYDRNVVGAEIGEEIFHAHLDEALKQTVGARLGCHVRPSGFE
jgi:hypothetical protein